MAETELMLQAEDLNVYYGSIHAIQGVSFTVNKGEIVTLIGANGAGKSTTLNTVSGLLRSKTGSLTFRGENISGMAPHTIVRKGSGLPIKRRQGFTYNHLAFNFKNKKAEPFLVKAPFRPEEQRCKLSIFRRADLTVDHVTKVPLFQR